MSKVFAQSLRALVLAGLALQLLPANVAAQPAWPQRTVKFILPLGPGSGVDVTARLFGDRLSAMWHQPVVIENRPGGDSMVAIGAFLGAHDDHTLLFSPSSAFTAHPYQHAKMTYDPREIEPVARVSVTLVVLSTSAASGFKTVQDLVDAARKAPGKLNWASTTGLTDFLFLSFVKTANLDMVRVPYRDPVQAVNDLGENRIQAYVAAYTINRPVIDAGKVKALALTNTARTDLLAGMPTVREAGYPALEFDGLTGLFGTKEVDGAARARIAADVKAAAADKDIAEKLAANGQVLKPGNAAEFAADMETQKAVAAASAKTIGITPAQ